MRLCVAAALLITLSACGGGSGTEPPTATPASAAAPRSFTLDGQVMLPCGPDAAVCGRLTVPEDRSHPDGRQIALNVRLVPAVASDPQPDPVFFLAGGPGGASTQSWWSAPDLFPIVHWDRDIVLVDQRGTGDSNLLLWPELPDLSGLSRHEMSGALASWMDVALAGLDADPRFYASPQAADDLDDVRAALGYDRIDLYGASYGATLAQYYLRQHGSHVGSVVLDGGTLLDVPILELLPGSSQSALDSVLERCAADTACHAAFPDPAGDLERAMARLAKDPVRTDIRDPWTDEPIVVNAGALAAQIHYLLVTSDSADVPLVLHQAATGTIEPIAERIRDASEDPSTSSNAMVMYWSIVCSEGWARDDPAKTARLGAGSYLLRNQLDAARTSAFGCRVMPEASLPPGDTAPVRSDVAVLLLNGTEDPQDPPSNVADAAAELPNSLSIAVPALGHTVGHLGCLPSIVSAFFEVGSVEGLDTSCIDQMTAAPFATT
ncbi:MAG: alpha/beta hydrolase [Actinomycetota bacterium]